MKHFISLVFLLCCCTAFGQVTGINNPPASPAGGWARLEIENGDSTYVMSLRLVRITAKRNFRDLDEQKRYYQYMRAAKKVYPYAIQALTLYDNVRKESSEMKKRARKRYLRNEHKELREDFERQMKSLNKTEGKVLIKMLERELDEPFYDVIKDTRGAFTATYWHNLGKFWGYDLKQGYHLGADTLLDDVLLEYDFGHPEWWYY